MLLDDSAWPVVRISLGPIEAPAEFDVMAEWYGERLRRAHAEGVELYAITDAESGRFNLPLARHAARWQRRLSQPDLDRCRLSVIIAPHEHARRWLTTILWFARPRAAITVALTEAEGWQAVVDDVRRRGQPLPSTPAWLRG